MSLKIKEVKEFYRGFSIDQPLGNNAFSYEERSMKRIYVAPLMEAGLEALKIGTETAFSEYANGQESNLKGLESFLYLPSPRKDIFIFDNHNHAFFFWAYGVKTKRIAFGSTLLHVDQHTDFREPKEYFDPPHKEDFSLQEAFEYTNYKLNVGNFIKPAMRWGIFNKVEMLISSDTFEKNYPDPFVLDIDIDIFAKEMDYIPYAFKIKTIRRLISQANFITMATSPYFIEQDRAIEIIKELF